MRRFSCCLLLQTVKPVVTLKYRDVTAISQPPVFSLTEPDRGTIIHIECSLNSSTDKHLGSLCDHRVKIVFVIFI